MRSHRAPPAANCFRGSNAVVFAAALLILSVIIWGSALMAVHNMDGGTPRLRTHRASPLPRVAGRSSAVDMSDALPGVPGQAGPGSWMEELGDEDRQLHASMRLSDVGVEARPHGASLLRGVAAASDPRPGTPATLVRQALSWKPRIFRLHNLLTSAECDLLVELGRPQLEASTVVDTATGQGMLSQVRTSNGMFITENTPGTLLIRKRIAHLTMLPEENQEAISILRYQPGQFYRPHQDFFADQTNINRGGQRTATVLIYLTDVQEGGETLFPNAGGHGTCDCGGKSVRGLCVRPRKGDAVLFYTTRPNAAEDSSSLHGGCEVIAGEKWSATLWIRTGKFT